jgi:hypothetical protein
MDRVLQRDQKQPSAQPAQQHLAYVKQDRPIFAPTIKLQIK